jgi:hypothetical protein
MAFVIIGIGDRPNSVELDAYHIDPKSSDLILVNVFTQCLLACCYTFLPQLCKVAIS